MKKKVLVILMATVFLLSFAMMGCGGGVSQQSYDQLAAQYEDTRAALADIQAQMADLEKEKAAARSALDDCEDDIAALEAEVENLKEQYELVGSTPAETAAKIVKYYYDTHVYSTFDLFICSDMASEVWNMLKAQGINAIIAIGDTNNVVSDILQCNHAWVLAEVAPGEYLALEATGGYVVKKGENPYYYNGWYFDSPSDLKRHNELVREHNTRVGIIKDIHDEVIAVAAEHDAATNPVTAEKLKAVYDKLVEVRDAQDAKLKQVKAELDSLAKRLL